MYEVYGCTLQSYIYRRYLCTYTATASRANTHANLGICTILCYTALVCACVCVQTSRSRLLIGTYIHRWMVVGVISPGAIERCDMQDGVAFPVARERGTQR